MFFRSIWRFNVQEWRRLHTRTLRCLFAGRAFVLLDSIRSDFLYIIKKIINAFLNKKKYNKINDLMAFYRRRFAEAYYEKRTNEFYGTRRHAYRG